MSRAIAVLRPEPGNRVTAAAIEAAGRSAIRLPLFAARPVAWQAPDPATFDALILTSANALRHGGPQLAALARLPVHAVGSVTAEAARRHGFHVVATGEAGATALLAQSAAMGVSRGLHLGGRERTIERGGIVADAIAVYASDALPIAPEAAARLAGSVVLVQSARAGARLAEIVSPTDRARILLVAIGAAAAAAAGTGWEGVHIASAPSSEALIDTALALAD